MPTPTASPRPSAPGGVEAFTPLGSARATAERAPPGERKRRGEARGRRRRSRSSCRFRPARARVPLTAPPPPPPPLPPALPSTHTAPAAPPSRASGTVPPTQASRRSSGAGSVGDPCTAPSFDDAGPGVVPGAPVIGGYEPAAPPAQGAWGGAVPVSGGATVAPSFGIEGGGGDKKVGGGGAAAATAATTATTATAPPLGRGGGSPPHHLHPSGLGRGSLGYAFTRASRPNWVAWGLALLWLASLGFYLYVRAGRSLKGLAGPYLGYGAFVLAVEALGATTVALYAYNLLWIPLHEAPVPDAEHAAPGMPRVALPYHVRVLVPCYKEDLGIVQRTVLAAAAAPLPSGCARTVYLCDDGKDRAKKAWIKSLGAGFVYVSGRARPPGEMNGKSGNLNNVCRQLYPAGVDIPGSELVCVFDADQVATSAFFARTLPLFDGGDDVAMVLSPQVSREKREREGGGGGGGGGTAGRALGWLSSNLSLSPLSSLSLSPPPSHPLVLPQPGPPHRHLQPLQHPLLGVRAGKRRGERGGGEKREREMDGERERKRGRLPGGGRPTARARPSHQPPPPASPHGPAAPPPPPPPYPHPPPTTHHPPPTTHPPTHTRARAPLTHVPSSPTHHSAATMRRASSRARAPTSSSGRGPSGTRAGRPSTR